jgi:hypothetical protein
MVGVQFRDRIIKRQELLKDIFLNTLKNILKYLIYRLKKKKYYNYTKKTITYKDGNIVTEIINEPTTHIVNEKISETEKINYLIVKYFKSIFGKEPTTHIVVVVVSVSFFSKSIFRNQFLTFLKNVIF